jgi:hypothetical protein
MLVLYTTIQPKTLTKKSDRSLAAVAKPFGTCRDSSRQLPSALKQQFMIAAAFRAQRGRMKSRRKEPCVNRKGWAYRCDSKRWCEPPELSYVLPHALHLLTSRSPGRNRLQLALSQRSAKGVIIHSLNVVPSISPSQPLRFHSHSHSPPPQATAPRPCHLTYCRCRQSP